MKSINCTKPGNTSITISNIPYNLIFTTKFNDSPILITIISCAGFSIYRVGGELSAAGASGGEPETGVSPLSGRRGCITGVLPQKILKF